MFNPTPTPTPTPPTHTLPFPCPAKVTFGALMHFAGRDYTNYLEVKLRKLVHTSGVDASDVFQVLCVVSFQV